MRDDLVKVFCEEYTRHMNTLQSQKDQNLTSYTNEQTKLFKERENIIQAIKQGIAADLVKDDLEKVSSRLKELEALLSNKSWSRPFLHPVMAQRYRKVIKNLRQTLNHEDGRAEAHLHLRSLIEKIILTPQSEKDELYIDLHGDLAGILRIASQENPMKNKSLNEKRLRQIAVNDNFSSEPSVMLVAGAGFEPTTFGL